MIQYGTIGTFDSQLSVFSALSCGLKTLVLRMLHVRLLPLETLNLVKLASYLATWKAQHSTVNEALSAVEYNLKVSRLG